MSTPIETPLFPSTQGGHLCKLWDFRGTCSQHYILTSVHPFTTVFRNVLIKRAPASLRSSVSLLFRLKLTVEAGHINIHGYHEFPKVIRAGW